MTRPLHAGTAPGAGPTPTYQHVVQAVVGIVRRPRSTFQRAVSKPRWGALLLATTVVAAAAGVGLMATAVGQQALVDQWERTAVAFGQELDDAGYARLEAWSGRAAMGYALVGALVSGPVLTVAVAMLLRLWSGGSTTLGQSMTVATYAGVILALRQVVAAPIGFIRESTASATSLGSLFSTLDEASPAARFLGALDLFVIWWVVVLAIGVSVLHRRRARSVAAIFVSLYAVLALLLAIAMAVTGGGA